jgi:hypothetical protein
MLMIVFSENMGRERCIEMTSVVASGIYEFQVKEIDPGS